MTREEERRIIDAVLGGDVNAFEALVLENQKQVYNLALRMTGSEEDAFDISQDAFLRAYKSLDSFRGDSKFSVWLYRLTSNICIDYLRARDRRKTVSLQFEDEDDEAQEFDIPDLRFSPDAVFEQKQLREAVSRALDALPADYRHILILREMNGLSYEEIADTLDLELGTVKSRIFRARKKLCSILLSDGNLSGLLPSNKAKGEV